MRFLPNFEARIWPKKLAKCSEKEERETDR